uniref:Uncharacterized protein n=1 Tax=Amphimedon queenslandica TaxID=400682 RepID=A0A1X7V5E5_AMPQE
MHVLLARKKLKFDASLNENKDSTTPIYERPAEKYAAEEIILIVLDPPGNKICTSKPFNVSKSATYIVDVTCLNNVEDIKRITLEFGNYEYNPHNYCLVVYHIPRNFVPTITSHGNSKDKKPFFPAWPSTCDCIKSHCSSGPKATLHQVSFEGGCLTPSAAPGELLVLRSSELIDRIHHLNFAVDLSFSLGNFDVTSITYRHSLLETGR